MEIMCEIKGRDYFSVPSWCIFTGNEFITIATIHAWAILMWNLWRNNILSKISNFNKPKLTFFARDYIFCLIFVGKIRKQCLLWRSLKILKYIRTIKKSCTNVKVQFLNWSNVKSIDRTKKLWIVTKIF